MKSDQWPEEVPLKPKGLEPRPISKPEGTDTSLPPKPPKRESLPPPDNNNSLSPDEVKNPTRDEAPPRMSSSRANYVALVLALIGWCIAGYLLIQKQSSSAASTRNSEQLVRETREAAQNDYSRILESKVAEFELALKEQLTDNRTEFKRLEGHLTAELESAESQENELKQEIAGLEAKAEAQVSAHAQVVARLEGKLKQASDAVARAADATDTNRSLTKSPPSQPSSPPSLAALGVQPSPKESSSPPSLAALGVQPSPKESSSPPSQPSSARTNDGSSDGQIGVRWAKMCRFLTGRDQGKWFYQTPSGQTSRLFSSREAAAAEARKKGWLVP